MELSVGQGLILYTLTVMLLTAGTIEVVRSVRKTRILMKETKRYEVDR
jgi:hypothetical protein